MSLTITEIILLIGFLGMTGYCFRLNGKIDSYKELHNSMINYNSYLFHNHRKIGELSLSLVKSLEDVIKRNQNLFKEKISKN